MTLLNKGWRQQGSRTVRRWREWGAQCHTREPLSLDRTGLSAPSLRREEWLFLHPQLPRDTSAVKLIMHVCNDYELLCNAQAGDYHVLCFSKVKSRSDENHSELPLHTH